MENVQSLLNFDFSPDKLNLYDHKMIPEHLIELRKKCIEKLNMISQNLGEPDFNYPSQQSIPEVFKKFKSNYDEKIRYLSVFEKRELRTLCYALTYSEKDKPPIFNSENELTVVINTLENSWMDFYLLGLVDCLLKNWESPQKNSIVLLSNFIFSKLIKYSGNSFFLKTLQINIRFFDINNGNILLAKELDENEKPLIEAAQFLSFPKSWFHYFYFSKTIVAYYEKQKSNLLIIDELVDCLEEHNNSITNKRVISKMIIQTFTYGSELLKEKVKNIAFEMIGDVSLKSNWLPFENATQQEKEEIDKAWGYLNEWINKQFIDVFFEKCINDPGRKKFWLKYAKQMSQLRFVGSQSIKNELEHEKQIGPYHLSKFTITNKSSKNVAVMFFLKEHLFVEFGESGYLYIYAPGTKKYDAFINSSYFDSVEDLKTKELEKIVLPFYKNNNTVKEGKIGHHPGWENVTETWIKEKLGINA